MKTPMQEVYENFNKMSDADFKAWMLNTDLLEKEKEVIKEAWMDDRFPLDKEWVKQCAEQYYNETFNIKER